MIHRFLTFILLFCTLGIASQNTSRVTIEDSGDPAYAIDMAKVSTIRNEITIAKKKIGVIQTRPKGKANKHLQDWINHNLRIKSQFEASGIDQKCKRALAINKKWDPKFYTDKRFPCNEAQRKINRLDELITEANRKLNNSINDKKQNESLNLTEKISLSNHKKEISKLNEESKKLDELLKNKKKKKVKSFDEILKLKGKKTKSLSQLTKKRKTISSFNSETKKNTKSLFAKKSSAKSLTAKLNSVKDENESYKITKRGNLTGVVSSKGKTLIPFRKWIISEYKYGIARVSIPFDTYTCSAFDEFATEHEFATEATAYKNGYVDESGRFIDGFEVSASGGDIYVRTVLTLRKAKYYNIESEEERRRRIYKERQDEIRRKAYQRKKKAAKKKCANEVKRWKLSVTSKY